MLPIHLIVAALISFLGALRMERPSHSQFRFSLGGFQSASLVISRSTLATGEGQTCFKFGLPLPDYTSPPDWRNPPNDTDIGASPQSVMDHATQASSSPDDHDSRLIVATTKETETDLIVIELSAPVTGHPLNTTLITGVSALLRKFVIKPGTFLVSHELLSKNRLSKVLTSSEYGSRNEEFCRFIVWALKGLAFGAILIDVLLIVVGYPADFSKLFPRKHAMPELAKVVPGNAPPTEVEDLEVSKLPPLAFIRQDHATEQAAAAATAAGPATSTQALDNMPPAEVELLPIDDDIATQLAEGFIDPLPDTTPPTPPADAAPPSATQAKGKAPVEVLAADMNNGTPDPATPTPLADTADAAPTDPAQGSTGEKQQTTTAFPSSSPSPQSGNSNNNNDQKSTPKKKKGGKKKGGKKKGRR